jgi:hypothetical protein
MGVKLNVKKLVDKLGGEANTARLCGVARTAPYGWVVRNFVSSDNLAKIKAARPEMDLDWFFEDDGEPAEAGDK